MSIKKLGGIRLRLVTGLTAALVASTAVFAFMLTPSIVFSPDAAFENSEAVLVYDDLASDTYFLVPKNREENPDLTGWAHDDDEDGDGTENDGYVFDTQVGRINVGTLSGSGVIFIKTEDVGTTPDSELTSMELWKGSVGGTGTLIGPADITILAQ